MNTSMSVAAGFGLGEGVDVNWADIVKTGIETGTAIYSSQQKERALKAERDFEIKMAKLTRDMSMRQAQDSSGETTADGLWGSNKTPLIIGGVALLAIGGYLMFGRRSRR